MGWEFPEPGVAVLHCDTGGCDARTSGAALGGWFVDRQPGRSPRYSCPVHAPKDHG